MSPLIKTSTRWVIWGGTFLLLLHFAFTVVYTVPGVPVPAVVHKASYRYMVPAFHQGWQLFAPDVPGYQVEFRVRHRPLQGSWGKWSGIRELQPDARMHYALAKMAGPLTTALNDDKMGMYYVDSIPQYDRVENSGAYKAVVYYFMKEHLKRKGAFPDSLQLEISYLFTPALKGDSIPENLTLTFPPIDIPE